MSSSTRLANGVRPPGPVRLEVVDLLVEITHRLNSLFNRRRIFLRLLLPALDAVDLSRSATVLGVDLLADLAFGAEPVRLLDQPHTARFTNAVLLVAMAAEMSPLPVVAGEYMLIVEAHGREAQPDKCQCLVAAEERWEWYR